MAGARAAYERAIESGHADAAPRVALHLGILLEKQADAAGACAAYEHALKSGNPQVRRAATFSLGSLLAEQGEVAGARAAFERGATECGCGNAAPHVARILARLHRRRWRRIVLRRAALLLRPLARRISPD